MKKFFITVVLSLSCVLSVSAQKQTEASTLNLIGKPFESTPNPYHRVDTLVYKGFNRTENRQLRCSAGMAVLFKTNTRNNRLRQSGDMYIRAIQPCRSLIKDMIFISKMQTVNGSMRQAVH